MKKSDKTENKYITVLAVIVAIVIAIIGLNLYSNSQNEESNITLEEFAEHEANNIESASSSLGNNVEQSQNDLENNSTDEVQTSTDNTEVNQEITNSEESSDVYTTEEKTSETNAQSEDVQDNTDENTQTEDISNEDVENTNSEVEVTFIKPVEGEIIKEFAKENLVYSDTLLEWTTHLGIDIQAEKTTVVKASADGTVKSIKNDPRYGLTIIIEHQNGYQTVYSNLLSSEFVVEGENVTQGQSIGTVGNTATFEIADNTHLHFELLQNGMYLDPTVYIK